MNAILDAAIGFGERHEREIVIASSIWFVISCASWIPFVPIPKIPYLTDTNSWMLSGGWNAVWWGFVHPTLERRRVTLKAEGSLREELPGD